MPYIDREAASEVGLRASQTPEELAYEICVAINDFVRVNGLSARTCIGVFGALAEADQEFRHRISVPYEALARGRAESVDPLRHSAKLLSSLL